MRAFCYRRTRNVGVTGRFTLRQTFPSLGIHNYIDKSYRTSFRHGTFWLNASFFAVLAFISYKKLNGLIWDCRECGIISIKYGQYSTILHNLHDVCVHDWGLALCPVRRIVRNTTLIRTILPMALLWALLVWAEVVFRFLYRALIEALLAVESLRWGWLLWRLLWLIRLWFRFWSSDG